MDDGYQEEQGLREKVAQLKKCLEKGQFSECDIEDIKALIEELNDLLEAL